jgi:hypothetical protein
LLIDQVVGSETVRRRVIFNPELVVRGSTLAGADAPLLASHAPAFATE